MKKNLKRQSYELLIIRKLLEKIAQKETVHQDEVTNFIDLSNTEID